MKTYTKSLVLAICMFCALSAGAQQDPMISQYMSNGLFLNPAYAGSHSYATLSGVYRKQWTDFPGAPNTAFATYDARVPGSNIGLGLIVSHDQVGVSRQTDIAGNFAYHIPLRKGQLALGIKAMVSRYDADVKDLTVWDQSDVVFANNIQNRWIPNFGTGAYYYTDRFYAGVSVPHLLNYDKPSTFFSAQISSVPAYERHYYVTSGYVFDVSESVYLKPSVLVKYVPGASNEADLNLNVFFMNVFSVGVSYRTSREVVAMVEVNASQRIRIGYAYDHAYDMIGRISDGTHEIMVSYDFIREFVKIKTPRFF